MRRWLQWACMVIIIVSLAACGAAATAPGEGDTGDGTTASSGGQAMTAAGLVDALETAGLTVTPAGTLDPSITTVPGATYKVGNGDLQIYEYADPMAARADAEDVALEKSQLIRWIAPPNFFNAGKLFVIYLGDDQDALAALRSALGPALNAQ